jgi:fatty-acyl-CoA synthase
MSNEMDIREPQTFLEAFNNLVEIGDRKGFTFVTSDGQEHYYGFQSLVAEARSRGRKLRSLGLKKGDRLALIIPEPEDFILTFLGAVTAGIIPVPLYPPLSLGKLDNYLETTARILTASGSDVLVTTAQVQKVLWQVMGTVPTLKDLVTVDKLMARPEAEGTDVVITPQDTVFLQFTSGSTANPKGVVVTHGSLKANAMAILRDGIHVDPEVDKGVSWLPLYHDMGLIGFVLAPVFLAIPIVFIPTLSFVRRANIWMEMVHKHRGTMTFAPNFAFALATKRARESDLQRWDLSSLRIVGCGAEPIHPGTMADFVAKFGAAGLKAEAMMPCYGMAEATLAMSFNDVDLAVKVDVIDADRYHDDRVAAPVLASGSVGGPGANVREIVSCGKTFPDHELGIFDDDGKRLGERQVGEIWFRGPSVAAGYFRNPEETQKSFRPDGWLRTGDLGYLADGDLYISGRKKDILIINGRNYYPQTIECAVEAVHGIRKGNVVAFSVPGASSEEIVVVVESNQQDAQKRKELGDAVKAHLSREMGLAVSDVFLLGAGQLPKTTSGKLQRRKTREHYLNKTLGSEGVRTMGSTGERLMIARHVVRSLFSRVRHQAYSIIRPFFRREDTRRQ